MVQPAPRAAEFFVIATLPCHRNHRCSQLFIRSGFVSSVEHLTTACLKQPPALLANITGILELVPLL